MEQDESGVARSRHVVHVLPPGDARAAGVVSTQAQRISEEAAGVQLLVLTPGADSAAWIARLVNPTLDAGHTLLVPVTAPARAARRVSAGARAIAGSPSDALALVRGSALKLDSVTAVVLLDANELLAEAGEDVATLLSEVPKDATRIVIARESDEALEAFVEAHLRKARTMDHGALATSGGAVQYLVAARGDRATTLRRLLDTLDPARATILASEDDADDAVRALAAIGYAPDDASVRIVSDDIAAHEPLVVCFTPPLSAAALQQVTAATPKVTVAIVAPEELAAFLRVTGGMGTPLSLSSAPVSARSAEDALRNELRAVLGSRALHREVLAIAPMLSEHDAVEVAAAALRLLEVERERARAKRPVKAADVPVVSAPTERVAPVGTSFTKLFINVGERDGAKKGDFVGAITGEAGVQAEQVGKIELRDSHTIAEVASECSEKVIAALNGSTIRGRHVIAREDRGPSEREGGPSERTVDRGGDRGDRGGFRGADRGGSRGGSSGGLRGGDRGGDRGGYKGSKPSGFRGGDRDRGPRTGGGERSERSSFRGPDRPSRGYAGGGERGGFRGGDRNRSSSSEGGFRGPDRGPDRGSDRGPDRGGDRGAFRGPPRDRGPRRDEGASPQRGSMQRDDTRGPRAIGESSEWGNRGDSLRNARRRRPEE